ncbi:MAG: hypothetical protein F4060_04855 [Holophagales bacterium]|nr:hypothetical protein [Holophagales bacterium]
MQLENLSDDLRREIWNCIRQWILIAHSRGTGYGRALTGDGVRLFERVVGRLTRLPEDEVPSAYDEVHALFKNTILKDPFNLVLDLVEVLCNDEQGRAPFAQHMAGFFEQHAAPYWLDTSHRPYRFAPRSSQEQGDATRKALDSLRAGKMDGARTHLRNAVDHINGGRYADSVADSIHAVESVARLIDPKAAKTLGPALKSLERHGVLTHKALAEGFSNLYGYSSNEQGIRHALLDKDAPRVTLDEAVFMYGACASFAAYLVSKRRQVNQ